MGDCKYCGESAGFLRKQHKACAEKHDRAIVSIKALCVAAALHGGDLDALPSRIREAAATPSMEVPDDELSRAPADGWCSAVEAAVEDHSLSSEEKRGLNRYRERFDLQESRLDREGHFERFRMMALLNSLVDGGLVPCFDRRSARAEFGRLPFNLMKSEELIWVFTDVGYLEQVTRREYRGGSMGASFRVAKGVYVRPSSFRGRAVESTSMEHNDDGLLGITTKHLYFTGREKSFRIRLEKIVSFEPYQDGLGIMRDTARAKPEVFRMSAGDAWFSINVIDALLDRDELVLPKSDSPTLDDIVEGLAEEGSDDDDGADLFAAGGPTASWRAARRSSCGTARPAPGARTTAPRSRRQRCGPGSAGWASRHSASTPAVPGRTATGNPSPARSVTRAATPRSARPAPKPRSASSAGGARTTRCARTAPSGTGRPPGSAGDRTPSPHALGSPEGSDANLARGTAIGGRSQ